MGSHVVANNVLSINWLTSTQIVADLWLYTLMYEINLAIRWSVRLAIIVATDNCRNWCGGMPLGNAYVLDST